MYTSYTSMSDQKCFSSIEPPINKQFENKTTYANKYFVCKYYFIAQMFLNK